MALVSTPPDSDARLVERVLGGDRHAFAELLRRHDHRLRGVAYKLLAGDPHRLDDVMQEAYVKAYRSLHRFRVDAELRNMVVPHRLQRLHRRAAPSATPPTTVDVSAPALDRATSAAGPERAVDAADQARRALSALPEDQRSTVVLVDGEGFDNLTAAEILGVAPGTVASRLSRARVTMRRILDEAQP